MSPLRIRAGIRRFGCRSAGLLALLLVVGLVQVHHSDVSMAGMHSDGAVETIVLAVCAGALTAVGAAVASVTLGRIALGRWPLLRQDLPAAAVRAGAPMWARARAGPPPLVLNCVSRR